jgi:hypothetical protein
MAIHTYIPLLMQPAKFGYVTPTSQINPSGQTHQIQRRRSAVSGMFELMDDAEIDRLRRAICRSFNSSPHKKKYWLALLEMRVAAEKTGCSGARRRAGESSVRSSSGDSR